MGANLDSTGIGVRVVAFQVAGRTCKNARNLRSANNNYALAA